MLHYAITFEGKDMRVYKLFFTILMITISTTTFAATNVRVRCSDAVALARVQVCTDLLPTKIRDCEEGQMIQAGQRWMDEFQSQCSRATFADSAEDCILRFTEISNADACCGG